jgi:release factor glutamine methyltransferase
LLGGNALPHLERTVLLSYALGIARATLLADPDMQVTVEAADRFRRLAARRAAGEPIAYLVGRREFYGLDFAVGPEVLIPRPETEHLVDAALERIPAGASSNVLDLGTGSGAIALAIARHRPAARVVATDVSSAALALAERNARALGLANVEFVESDWYASLDSPPFDVIASNPPYVAAADPHLDAGDLRYEPRIALASGEDGLDAIRTIVAGAPARLTDAGWLLLEHGYDQGDRCRRLLGDAGLTAVTTLRDLAGIERVVCGRWGG